MSEHKFVKKNTKKIKRMVQETIPAMIAQGCTPDEYAAEGRRVLNFYIIQAMIGAEVKKGKKGKKGKKMDLEFSHSLPNKKEIAKIAGLLAEFIKDVEIPYLEANGAIPQQSSGADDMAIPHRRGDGIYGTSVPKIEKINAKKLRNYVFGYDGKAAINKMFLAPVDVMQLATIGEDLRKKQNRNKMLIIGGVALLLTGAAVVGVAMYMKHTKEDEEMLDDVLAECEDLDVDPDPDIDPDTPAAVDL